MHLHNHTQYSLLDGLTKLPDLVDKVKNFGMEAVAITDHGTLSGLIEMYKEAKGKGIKPILGIETYVAANKLDGRDVAKDKANFHLILIAKDNTGYKNLMKLSSIANLEGFYYKPRIDHEVLEKYSEGLIVLSGCMGSELGDAISQGLYSEAVKTAKWYKKVFPGRYYLEIQDHGHPKHPTYNKEQEEVNNQLFKIAKELDLPCVVTADAHYLNKGDQTAHEVLLCVQTNSYFDDPNRLSLKSLELYVTSPMEIIKRWGETNPDLISNTSLIASQCDVEIKLGGSLIPNFTTPKGFTEESYLENLVYQGLIWRYGGLSREASKKVTIAEAKKKIPKEVNERAIYELSVITSMKFNGYFLIVQDFINWGKDNGINFGPGRGSASGSIVSYALRITEIDPLKFDLMFERFLNPSRISMPDIDIDIQDNRRDEVIEYCVKKYGRNKVANIVTFGRMAARNAVRDVARVLEVPYIEADRLAKMIPPPVQGRHIPLKLSLKDNSDLALEYKTNETSKKVFDLAMQLEGTIRSHGVHAAGVVIAPSEIVNYTPLEMAQKGVIATQYSMGPIEELGLLKMDFLGLSNLTTISNALRIIKKVYKKDIDLSTIDDSDKKTFELLQRAETVGVFQLESAGMQRYLKELKPTLFDDIIAMGALYRPGPMGEIPRFIEGKNNPSKVKYLNESLEPILKNTYGVMVYQEQIIQLLQLVAGYTAGEADLVRKAIGKKRDIMTAEEPKFIAGCIKQGLREDQAKDLWAQILPFADYSFPKAHAATYALISYWTAYLKANFPQAYMAALLTSDYDDIERLAIEVNECRHLGLDVLPPDINQSFIEFGVVPETNKIRFGLNAIKNVGSSAAEEIVRAREKGEFSTLEDYLMRVNPRIVNKKALESLIKTGAFDNFGDRSALLSNMDLMLAFASKSQKDQDSNQLDLFAGEANENGKPVVSAKLKLEPQTAKPDTHQYLLWERELLGLYISHHPLSEVEEYLKKNTRPLSGIDELANDRLITVGGIISDIRTITAKNGQKMAFIKLEDMTGEREAVAFPSAYNKYSELLIKDEIIVAKAKISSRSNSLSGSKSLIIEELQRLDLEGPGAKSNDTPEDQKVYIRIKDTADGDKLVALKQTIDRYQGPTRVIMVLGEDSNKQAIRLPAGFDHLSSSGLNELVSVVGLENVLIS